MRAVGYIIAQFAGAALAWWALSGFISGSDSANAAAYGGQATELFKAASLTSGKEWFVFFSELLGTAILGFAVANALRKNQERLTSAFTVGLGIFIALMITYIATSYVAASTIINPAIAVALSALTFNNWWSIGVYVLAPVLGGIIGFLLNDFLKGRETN
jgi:glycerol uptake facilitator-like aquaporin